MGIDIATRIDFLGIDEDELAELAALEPAFAASADAFTAAFYQHLLSFDAPRGLLGDPDVRDRLLESQKQYFVSLCGPKMDAAYAERRAAIGRMHERVGLEPTWYIGAYALYLREIGRILSEHYRDDAARMRRAHDVLCKRILFDLQLAMEAYIDRRGKQLEFANRELAAAQRGLAREVREQREELKVTTARARAAEQLASVGVLAAGLAHEIGTPMSVIRGHAESLEGVVPDERSQWRVRTIVEQIDRITNIMQALLNLARPREPVIGPVDLGGVLETAASFLAQKLERRGIEVALEVDGDVVVEGDAEKLQQLFLNLILNAADAMGGGGELRLGARAVEGGAVHAWVADTGVGIEPVDLPRIFDPFFTTKPAGQGNGLGLVVARGIAIDHGGDIEVESELGAGTRFTVELPGPPEGSPPHRG
ncbi:MAG: protoglobin domain-containing protein [Myxococcota bacterium]|nr:hypothetical protein [Myxococcales bacterium]